MIITDVDDVLLDWLGGFKAFLDSKGITVKTQRPLNWDLTKWVHHESVKALVEEFNTSEAFGQLKPVEGAVEALTRLVEKHQIYAITSCGNDSRTVMFRLENLKTVFPNLITHVNCLKLGENKIEALSHFQPAAFWIEDRWENAVDGAAMGFATILLDRPYNGGQAEDVKVKRLGSWGQIAEHIQRYPQEARAPLPALV